MVNRQSKAKNILFSIIIPALDEEGTIDKLLQLLTNAKEKFNFEIIVSDGGSKDRTIEISNKYADKTAVWNQGRYQTIGGGRNAGAELAESENLIFINADTMPKNIDKFLMEITDWASGKGIYSKYLALAGRVEPNPDDIIWKDKFYYFCFNNYFKFLNVIGVGMGRGECQIIKKELFDELNGYDDNVAAGEDFDLFRRVAKKHKIKFADEIVVFESPRRFRKKGYLNTVLLWFLNSAMVMFSGRSLSKKWEKVR
jgi:glycosyltransferase involved in cell wall biosynthesis